jgi:hypothetical protein
MAELTPKENYLRALRHEELEDITEWKKKINIPDADACDWAKEAEICAAVDREKTAVSYFMAVGVFERVVTFMGFENALIAMVEKPDAVNEL